MWSIYLASHTQYNPRGLNGGWRRVQTPQAGSVKILAEEGTRLCFLADSKWISDVEYTALKSENELFKSLLTFETDTREKLLIQVDKLMVENQHLKIGNNLLKTEIDHLKTLLMAAECREKPLLEQKPPVLDRWLHNSVRYTDPEPWDGDIWYDSEDDGTAEDPHSKSDEGNYEICTTVHTIPWSVTQLAKLRRNTQGNQKTLKLK
ncbi:hypothetical protein BTVI_64317 [Pitangus sulphuratus]|nr:hypothetical protein BTVI_64317 [Pitangus sulphuratus]